jgi:hypothetical protein
LRGLGSPRSGREHFAQTIRKGIRHPRAADSAGRRRFSRQYIDHRTSFQLLRLLEFLLTPLRLGEFLELIDEIVK